jgi:hypothetical protein
MAITLRMRAIGFERDFLLFLTGLVSQRFRISQISLSFLLAARTLRRESKSGTVRNHRKVTNTRDYRLLVRMLADAGRHAGELALSEIRSWAVKSRSVRPRIAVCMGRRQHFGSRRQGTAEASPAWAYSARCSMMAASAQSVRRSGRRCDRIACRHRDMYPSSLPGGER